jgi:hypothetical protein
VIDYFAFDVFASSSQVVSFERQANQADEKTLFKSYFFPKPNNFKKNLSDIAAAFPNLSEDI